MLDIQAEMNILLQFVWGVVMCSHLWAYRWQFALFNLLSAPVQIPNITASQYPMKRVLQQVTIFII